MYIFSLMGKAMVSRTLGHTEVMAMIDKWRSDTFSDEPWKSKDWRPTWREEYNDIEHFLEWCSEIGRDIDIQPLELTEYEFKPITGVEIAKTLNNYEHLFLVAIEQMLHHAGDARDAARFITTESTFTDEEEAIDMLDMWCTLGMLDKLGTDYQGQLIQYTLSDKGREYLKSLRRGESK